MVDRPVKIGVIGVGFGAVVQIPGFQSEGLDVVAVCAKHEDRAKETASKFGIPNYFTDYNQMLNIKDIDAVSIVAPHHLHSEMALAVLAAGKHLLCEKPMAVDSHEAKSMWNASQKSHCTAMIGHEFRWAPQRSYVKELLDEGYIGGLRFVKSSLLVGASKVVKPRVLQNPDLGHRGGFLWALGSHYIDGFRHWFGDISRVNATMHSHSPERVDSKTGDIVLTKADDTFSVMMEFVNGGWGTLTGSSAAPFGEGANIEIFGDSGHLSTPQSFPGFNPLPDGKVYGGRIDEDKPTELNVPDRLRPFEDNRDQRLMAFRLMTREFVRGIREGISPAPNFEDGYRCQQVLDAVVESNQTGKSVDINLE